MLLSTANYDEINGATQFIKTKNVQMHSGGNRKLLIDYSKATIVDCIKEVVTLVQRFQLLF